MGKPSLQSRFTDWAYKPLTCVGVTDGNAASTGGGGGSGGGSSKHQGERTLVCPASPHNITAIFNPLQIFIREIEEALGCSPG